MDDVKLIKFDNGEVVVAVVEHSDKEIRELNFIEMLYPIEVVTNSMPSPTDNTVVERFSLKPWISSTDETLFMINTKGITTVARLKPEFVEGFQNMVNHFYFSSDAEKVIKEQSDEELDYETYLEYMQATEDNEIN
ncbi:MAG: hypothetical protein CBB97_11250 [Candidatus Endolissoclinum sp. TMED37]|nr:MAG: hypothetical protein CBB97_11250 [Candidatus Endolissoclinum sp. TMED37]